MKTSVALIGGIALGGLTAYAYGELKKRNLERNPEDILDDYEGLDLPEVEPVKPEDIGDPEVQKTLADWEKEKAGKKVDEGVDYD